MKTLSRGVMASPTVLSLISSALCTWHACHACMTLNFDLISHHKHNNYHYLDNEHLIIRERLFVALLVDSMHLHQLTKLWTDTIPFQQCTTGMQIVGKMSLTSSSEEGAMFFAEYLVEQHGDGEGYRIEYSHQQKNKRRVVVAYSKAIAGTQRLGDDPVIKQ